MFAPIAALLAVRVIRACAYIKAFALLDDTRSHAARPPGNPKHAAAAEPAPTPDSAPARQRRANLDVHAEAALDRLRSLDLDVHVDAALDRSCRRPRHHQGPLSTDRVLARRPGTPDATPQPCLAATRHERRAERHAAQRPMGRPCGRPIV